MKKLFAILSVCALLSMGDAQAQQGQGGGDPAAMMQRMKERVKPQLIEKEECIVSIEDIKNITFGKSSPYHYAFPVYSQ